MSDLIGLKSDSTELKELLHVAKRPRVKDVLKSELTSVDAKIDEIESKRAREEEKAAILHAKDGLGVVEDPNSKLKAAAKPAKETKVQRSKISSYGFDQKPKSFTIYIGLPGVGQLEKEKIKVEYVKRGLSIVVSNLNGKTHELKIPNLGGEIIPEQCKHKVKPDKMTVILKKFQPGDWANITGKEAKVAKEAKVEKEAKEAKAETLRPPEDEKENDPSESLMDLMKKMYDEGDDDMKRTIAKAWTESREKQEAAGSEN